jgi:hypothetical protein
VRNIAVRRSLAERVFDARRRATFDVRLRCHDAEAAGRQHPVGRRGAPARRQGDHLRLR